jgi:hypothetical protein
MGSSTVFVHLVVLYFAVGGLILNWLIKTEIWRVLGSAAQEQI